MTHQLRQASLLKFGRGAEFRLGFTIGQDWQRKSDDEAIRREGYNAAMQEAQRLLTAARDEIPDRPSVRDIPEYSCSHIDGVIGSCGTLAEGCRDLENCVSEAASLAGKVQGRLEELGLKDKELNSLVAELRDRLDEGEQYAPDERELCDRARCELEEVRNINDQLRDCGATAGRAAKAAEEKLDEIADELEEEQNQ